MRVFHLLLLEHWQSSIEAHFAVMFLAHHTR